jgi:maleylacetoacetate isomerase
MRKLYGYYRSQAAFRVRIALNLKGLEREDAYLNLARGDQFKPDYRAVNPQMVVPTLVDGDAVLFQSMAILEYLEEVYPEPPLLPSGAAARARVRGIAQIVVSDCHPLVIPRIRNYFDNVLKLDEAPRVGWIQHWLVTGSQALETILAESPQTGRFCHGDAAPSIADICVTTHVAGAKTHGCDMGQFPTLTRIFETCMAIPAFAAAHPSKQPDRE